MKSHRQEFKEKLDEAVETGKYDWDEGARMLLKVIHEQQTGGGRRQCGCRLYCDGMTTIVWWACRQHWWAELGGPVGATLMFVVGVFLCTVMILLVFG